MTRTTCGNGHIYDSDQYSVCPYCNGMANMISFDESDSPGRTAAPGFGAQAGYDTPGRTAAPGFAPAGGYEPGKTVAPESYLKEQQQSRKTVGVFKKHYDLDPVVGWLVCVEGPGKGRSHELYAKINSIGRGEGSDVCLPDDMTVSKEHARLAYEPRHHGYQLIPGQGSNNTYLNDEAIYIPAKLAAYDIIELGETKLLFIPLCGDRFHWETDSKRE